jgi:hypothetical protein
MLQVILNIDMAESVWNPATLPVSSGGLGVRLAAHLALLPFFVSCWVTQSDTTTAACRTVYTPRLAYETHSTSRRASSGKLAATLLLHACAARCDIHKAWNVSSVNRKLEEEMPAARTQTGVPDL